MKFTGLYCPAQGKAFYGILPPPNYYEWDASLLWSQENAEKTHQSITLKPSAKKLLEYFENVKSKTPKSLRDLKKADRLSGLSDSELTDGLNQLVGISLLVLTDKDNYSLTSWGD